MECLVDSQGMPIHENQKTYQGRVQKSIGDLLPQRKSIENILDIGCSIGATTLELASLYPEAFVTGIEINPVVLNHKKIFTSEGYVINQSYNKTFFRDLKKPENLHYSFIQAPFSSDCFSPNSFDLIVDMNRVYYSIMIGEEEKEVNEFKISKVVEIYLSQINSLLREEGTIIISGECGNFELENYERIRLIKRRGKIEIDALEMHPEYYPDKKLSPLNEIVSAIERQ